MSMVSEFDSDDVVDNLSKIVRDGYALSSEGYIPMRGEYAPRMAAGIYSAHLIYGGFIVRPENIISDELIDLPGSTAEVLFSDILSFQRKAAEFARFKFVHKRGYLLFGPPGTGKTAEAIMVSRRFVEAGGIVLLSGGQLDVTINAAQHIAKTDPGRAIMLVIEEIDNYNLDSSDVLSFFDGEGSISNCIVLATTNHLEELPPRIADRPGRFDRLIKVDCLPREVQKEFLLRLFDRGDISRSLAETHADAILDGIVGYRISLAHLREIFIAHRLLEQPLDEVIARIVANKTKDPVAAAAEDVASDDEDDLPEKVHSTGGEVPEPHIPEFMLKKGPAVLNP